LSDDAVRVALFERWLALERPPSPQEVAEAAGVEDVGAAYGRLHDAHQLVLRDGELWMAAPLSTVPTRYRVGPYFANCIWDAFGLIGMLGGTGTVACTCPCCDEPMRVEVEDRRLAAAPDGAVAHFVGPAARWWDDVGFT
jgi:hypothetical protein